MKKLLSVLLILTMIAGMALGASAATSGNGTGAIRGIDKENYISNMDANASRGYITINDKTSIRSLDDLTALDVKPGDVIKIQLRGNLFVDANKNAWGNSSNAVSASALRIADISLRTTCSSGEGSAEITLEGNSSGSYIKIEFSKNPAASNQRFSYAIYLNHKGTREAATRIPVKGRLESEIIEVDSNDNYANLSKGATVKAVTSVRNIELYLGEYCSITRNLTRGNQYSGIALTEILSSDEVLFNRYRSLEYIYRLETVGLKTDGNIVKLDLDNTYYVYNSNGTYIGTSNKALPYWTKYYLTSQKYESLSVR